MADAALESALAAGAFDVGQVRIRPDGGDYVAYHRDDESRTDLFSYESADAAMTLVRFDDSSHYRPLKTAPNLSHGWSLRLASIDQVRRALEFFYPGRLEVLEAFNDRRLEQTPLRETLKRQTGMYRAAANISDEGIDRVAGRVCRSDGGCLRTILWKKTDAGNVPSPYLPEEKFDPGHNQVEGVSDSVTKGSFLPLLCQEACSLLVDACRKAVAEKDADPA